MKNNKLILTLGALVILSAILFNFGGCVASKMNENLNEQALEQVENHDGKKGFSKNEFASLFALLDGKLLNGKFNLFKAFKHSFTQYLSILFSDIYIAARVGYLFQLSGGMST